MIKPRTTQQLPAVQPAQPPPLPKHRQSSTMMSAAVSTAAVSSSSGSEHAANITVGLLDGTSRSGRIGRFDPNQSDLAVDLDRFGRTFLAAERVAYLGFARLPNESITRPPVDAQIESLKVHLAGGGTFIVDTIVGTTKQGVVGFWGYPTDAQSPFKHIYFYAHGVNAKEKNVPLGEMLLAEGLLGTKTLNQGVNALAANRSASIGQILVEQGGAAPEDVEAAAALQARRKLRIGQILVEAGLASQESIDRALIEQKQRKGKRLGEVLVEMGVVSEADLAVTLGKKFQIPVVDLETIAINPAAAQQTPREVIEKFGILPIEISPAHVAVAICDPLAIDGIDCLRFHMKRRVDELLVTPTQLRRYVDDFIHRSEVDDQSGVHQFDELLRDLKAEDVQGAESLHDEDDAKDIAVTTASASDGGIVKLVNQIIIDAVRRGASDIHVEPNGTHASVSIRFRIDGECVTYQEVPASYRNQLIARIKIMANLDISERRKPQDGKIRFKVADRLTELRVATLPTVNGNEDAVLRILAGSKPMPLEKMGMSERNLRELNQVIRQPYGLILCVGPTGSGKTTTLHSAIGSINTQDTKIWTAEDPVEITQAGLRQVQVNAKIGLTFASCMRSFLRADPDVIMVGEMRDHETASTAVEASLTGHLVLSTLHTNSAPETITRLLDMGLDPFSFADSLLAVLAQRLTRALCKKCKQRSKATEQDFRDLARAFSDEALEEQFGITRDDESFTMWRAVGCDACSGSGYKGRLALHELLITNDTIKQQITRKSPVDQVRASAVDTGMTTLLQDGTAKAIAGLTDMKQVLAVCSK